MAIKDWKPIILSDGNYSKNTYEKNGRWTSWDYYPKKEKTPYIVSTIKKGELEIIGRFTTEFQAKNMMKKYLGAH